MNPYGFMTCPHCGAQTNVDPALVMPDDPMPYCPECDEALFPFNEKEKEPWFSADNKPEHNIGVLVFIPEEDNHITAGMWDESDKWILLDEYREPKCKVTHWMPLPSEPEEFKREPIPKEIDDALREIAKNELPPQLLSRETLVEKLEVKDKEIERLRGLLKQSVEIIKQWQCGHESWNQYCNNSPKMKPILEALQTKEVKDENEK